MKQLKDSGTEAKSFGIEFNKDGTVSYFAVVDKSLAAQKERIENTLAEKRAEKKTDAKPYHNHGGTSFVHHSACR